MTFREVSEEWISIHKHRIGNSTYIGYQNVLGHILPRIGDIEISAIKYSHLQRIIDEMSGKDYSKRTLTGIKNTISAIFSFAIKNEYISRDISKVVDIPRNAKTSRRDCLTTEEISKILQFEHRNSSFIQLLYYTGIRRGEALALTWGDIDLNEGFISITKSVEFIKNNPVVKSTKTTNGNRKIPIPTPLSKSLLKMMPINVSKKTYLFTQQTTGLPHTQTSYKKMWDRWWIDFNTSLGGTEENPAIKRITAHMFRHTYVTYLFENTVPDLMIQKLAGHAEISFTRKQYTHLRDDYKSQSYEMVRNIFNDVNL